MIACVPEKSQAQLILEDLAAENDRLRNALNDALNAHHRNLGDLADAFREDRGHHCQSRKALEAIRQRSWHAIKQRDAAQRSTKE